MREIESGSTKTAILLNDAFVEIAGEKERINARYLGNYLNKHRDRVIGDLQLKHAGTYQHAAKWKIEKKV
jgi:hypothetical protein